jgi:pyruvate/2-oxoglutarate dehydrogenase complex dihydrolipoamide acyltransferase (E2) component
MLSNVQNRIGLKVSLFVNLVIFIVIVAGSMVLITEQSRSLEAELLSRGKMQSVIGAKMIGKIIEEAIDNGVFSVGDAFDTSYEPIGSFDPPKYHTKYDFYLDKSILNIEDEFLLDESIVFAVAVDINGYLPTHNTKYQQPITGDKAKDLVGNRTKRIFNDPVGLAAAKNTEKGFLQIYKRDTGETMWDISKIADAVLAGRSQMVVAPPQPAVSPAQAEAAAAAFAPDEGRRRPRGRGRGAEGPRRGRGAGEGGRSPRPRRDAGPGGAPRRSDGQRHAAHDMPKEKSADSAAAPPQGSADSEPEKQ